MTETDATTTTSYQKVFREAVRKGDLRELQSLLLRRYDKLNINLHDSDGLTALHQGCLAGDLDLVKLLVESGADVAVTNRDGFSALHIAAFRGHRHIAFYLINLVNALKH